MKSEKSETTAKSEKFAEFESVRTVKSRVSGMKLEKTAKFDFLVKIFNF